MNCEHPSCLSKNRQEMVRNKLFANSVLITNIVFTNWFVNTMFTSVYATALGNWEFSDSHEKKCTIFLGFLNLKRILEFFWTSEGFLKLWIFCYLIENLKLVFYTNFSQKCRLYSWRLSQLSFYDILVARL